MSAPHTFQLTGGVRDPAQMKAALERASQSGRRGPAAVLGYDPRWCGCCGQQFEPDTTLQVDCRGCVARIPYRLRRLGRAVEAWSPRQSFARSLARKAVAA